MKVAQREPKLAEISVYCNLYTKPPDTKCPGMIVAVVQKMD